MRHWWQQPHPAVIFDFNGTLSDDEPILLDIFTDVFRSHLGWSMTSVQYREDMLGLSDREIVELAVKRSGRGDSGAVEDMLRHRHVLYADRVSAANPITDDTKALVHALADKAIPLAVVTGAQRDDVFAVLAASPIGPLFDVTITMEDVERGKPDPQGFLMAADLMAREPADIVVFEDSVPGVQGALAAGMGCIAVSAEPSSELRAIAPAIVPALTARLFTDVLDGYR
jgi:beta-phosphoglucomutase